MKLRNYLLPALAAGALLVNAAFAAPQADTAVPPAPLSSEEKAADSQTDLEALAKKLMGKLGVRVTEVNATPMAGLYEAVIEGNEVLYTDKNADFLIMGQLFEAKSQKNLTAETKDRLNRIDFASLPLQDAIKTVHGTGARRIAIFSDPYCSFCRKLEASLKEMKDVTIYTFLYPVIRPNSKEMSEDIWCSKDPAAAWDDFMFKGTVPAKKADSCDTSALTRNLRLGAKFGVTGTPTIFVESGHRAPGAVSLEYLEKMLISQAAK